MAIPLHHEVASLLIAQNLRKVAFTGSGGKTSLILGVSHVLREAGVLITTTTKLASVDDVDYPVDDIALDPATIPAISKGKTTLWAKPGQKLRPVDQDLLHTVSQGANVILIEADGARSRALTFHQEGEPVIPTWVDGVVCVVGLGAIGKELSEETMHRYNRYRRETGSKERAVTQKTLETLLTHPDGVLKGCANHTTIVVFTQCDVVDQSISEAAIALAKKERRISYVVAGSNKGEHE
ncbi:MAG: selenium cofactor biosynthesis protein YqeC [Sphaerochaeta sp.]